jgi:hypothetical protein
VATILAVSRGFPDLERGRDLSDSVAGAWYGILRADLDSDGMGR